MMRRIAQFVSELCFVRWSCLLFIKIHEFFVRLWSNLKFKALVPNSGNSICHYSTEIKYGKNISIGDNCKIGKYSCLGAKASITLGSHVTLSRGVIIETAALSLDSEPPYKHYAKPIVIEDGVWLASNVLVLAGVTIKKNALIGAGAVITKDVNEGEVVVGGKNRIL